MKEDEEDQKTLWEILTQLNEEDSPSITYMGIISDKCIEYLNERGYKISKQEQSWAEDFYGEIKYFYDISY